MTNDYRQIANDKSPRRALGLGSGAFGGVAVRDNKAHEVSRRLLEPYHMPAGSPYLSADQQHLSQLDLEGRSRWMAHWLRMAAGVPDRDAGVSEAHEG